MHGIAALVDGADTETVLNFSSNATRYLYLCNKAHGNKECEIWW